MGERDMRHGRYLIGFDEYADVEVADVWQGWRNPVKYADSKRSWDQFRSVELAAYACAAANTEKPLEKATVSPSDDLTIAKAKVALAETYGVSPTSIEITIRG